MNTTLTLVNIFAVIVFCELIASPTAAVSLAAERAHCIDAGFSKAAVVTACDAFIDIFTGDTIWLQLVAHETRADNFLACISALLLTRSTTSASVIQVWVLLFILKLRSLSWLLEVRYVSRREVCGLLALDATCSEDQSTLVANHKVVLTALTLGRFPQQAALAAPLHKHSLEAGVILVCGGTAVLLVGQVDASGTVQLLQLVVAALLLDHPAFFGFRGVRLGAVPLLRGHPMSICTAAFHRDVCAHLGDQH